MRSHVRVSTHVKNPLHERKIARVNITVNGAILHIPSRDFVVTNATLVTVTFCFHNSALFCFIVNKTFNMIQQQKTLYFGYTKFGSHVPFQIIKSNQSCRQAHTCEMTLLHQLLLGIDCLKSSINCHRKSVQCADSAACNCGVQASSAGIINHLLTIMEKHKQVIGETTDSLTSKSN